MEGNRHGVIRIALAAANIDGSDDFGIGAVLIIKGADFRRFRWDFIEPHNAKPKAGLDIGIGCGRIPASRPCRIAKVRCFKEHGQRQILMGYPLHPGAQAAA